MIDRLLRGAFARRGLTLALAAAAVTLGVVWLTQLKRDVFPDLSAPVFNVIVQNASMGAEELETGIAVPLEAALAGLPDVRRVRSTSQLGVCQVTIEFESHASYFTARQLVSERIAQAVSSLPPGTEPPLVSSLTGRLNEIFEFTLDADPGAADAMTLTDLAEFDVKNRLLAVPGVAAMERLGGGLREFQVQIDPARMAARRVTLDDILHAVEDANLNAAGGVVTDGPMEWTVQAVGRAGSVEDIARTAVAVRGETTVLLGDVAHVVEAPATRRGVAHAGSGEVVSCRVTKQFGANTQEVAAGVRAALDGIRRALPPGVHLRVVYDQSDLIAGALGGVGRAIALGALFVVLVIFVLLGDLRAAMLVTLTLPLSIGLAGLLLRPLGVGLNTMTLGGLAIAVGLLVDAAIIVTENIAHRLRAAPGATAAERRDVVLRAASEVGRPIAFATCIVIAVFLPLFVMGGIEGRMYKPLAGAVVAALAASLALALTVVPVVAASALRAPDAAREEDAWLIRRLKRVYAPLLAACMRRPARVIAVAVAVCAAAAMLAVRIGSDFMPALDEGALLVQTFAPAEASLDEVDSLNLRVESILRGFPEVRSVVRRTGRAERTEDPMPHTVSDVLIVLQPQRGGSLGELEDAMREKLESVPGLAFLFTTPLGMRIDEGLGGTPADLSVRIFGPDLDELSRQAARVERVMRGVEGIDDVRAERLTGLPQLRVTVDRLAVARVGLTPGDVINALRVGLAGEEVSEVWRGQRRYGLVVRLPEARRHDVRAIRSLLVGTHDGTPVPLSQLAAIDETFGPGAIRREAGSRRIAVDASVVGRDLGGAAREVHARLAREVKLPAGYFVDIGGRVENQARAARALALAIAGAVFAVFVLLYLALDSVVDALAILATIPVAFVGGIVALSLSGETWNVSSMVGLIGLFGIAVQNGLVLVTQTRALLLEGHSFADAVREASIGRVRPKVMTAATAILGLLPLLVLRLHGTEIERPLAVVMVGGLITSTLFTLLALPTFYLLVHRARGRFGFAPKTPVVS